MNNMNCTNCDNKLTNDAKFCNKCGNPIEKIIEPEINIEKLKKTIKNTGDSLRAAGWLAAVANGIYCAYCVWAGLNTGILPVVFFLAELLIVVSSIVSIILGNRIRRLADKRIKTYLQISLGLYVLISILVIATGGTFGIIFFLVVGYIINSLFVINKLMKTKEFTVTLTNPKYKLNKKGWIIFAATTATLFGAIIVINFLLLKSSGVLNNATKIKGIVEEAKKGITLPNQIDEVTTLVDITAEPTAIRYHYIISGIDPTQLTNDSFKNSVMPEACKNSDIKDLLNQDVNMEYSYVVSETQQDYLFSITKDDCAL
jgi:hypothetical protein